jgi:hypothetical protein
MKTAKTQTRKIIETYITVVVFITAMMLVLSGIAVSKINTDYMESGVRAGKIVAERQSQQISLTTHEGIELNTQTDYLPVIDKVLTFLPPPVNTTYLIAKEVYEMINRKSDF